MYAKFKKGVYYEHNPMGSSCGDFHNRRAIDVTACINMACSFIADNADMHTDF